MNKIFISSEILAEFNENIILEKPQGETKFFYG